MVRGRTQAECGGETGRRDEVMGMALPLSGVWQVDSDEVLAGVPLCDLIKSPQGAHQVMTPACT